MTMQPLFAEIDGEIRMTPASVLLTAARSAYGDPDQVSAADAARGKAFVSELLVAAQDGGFKQMDVAETVLAQHLSSRRSIEMAQAACACITKDTMQAVFMRVGLLLGPSK